MFELLKLIVEKVVKSICIPDVVERHRKKRLTEIGTNLFILYTSLNNIYVTGLGITKNLEHYLRWMKRKIDDGEADREYWTHLPFLLREQSSHLNIFIRSLSRLALELQAVSPDAFIFLGPFLRGKMPAIGYLLEEISTGVLPVFDESSLLGIINTIRQRLDDPKVAAELVDDKTHLLWIVHSQLGPDMTPDLRLTDLGRIGVDKYEVIRNYIRERKPRDVVESLKPVLDKLRADILEQFSLQDILLNVGDHRSLVSSTSNVRS